MNLAERLRQETQKEKASKESVIQEIVDYFEKKFQSENFEKYIEDSMSLDHKRNGKRVFYNRFWSYESGCSDTEFRVCGIIWHNPDNPHGYDSSDYKKFSLEDLQNPIMDRAQELVIEALKNMGFSVFLNKKYNNLGYRNDTLTISW